MVLYPKIRFINALPLFCITFHNIIAVLALTIQPVSYKTITVRGEIMYFWYATYGLVILGAVISLIASANVEYTYKKYSKFYSSKGITAERCAQVILRDAGIDDVRIERVSGSLTDHYSPKEKVLRLSGSVYGSSSAAAIGVAAHECGHAIQHKEGYFPLKLRSASTPIAYIGSNLSWPIILLGLIFGSTNLANAGVVLFGFVVLFQLITLPVEFNASRRALTVLESESILESDELKCASKVLRAAALTYVAALFTSIMQLLRLIIIAGSGNRRDR